MGINLTNFLSSKSKNKKMKEFQDLDHIDGVSISSVNADLYDTQRDDLVMFYLRDGANHASVYHSIKSHFLKILSGIFQKREKKFFLC
jgi:hypothetical protein